MNQKKKKILTILGSVGAVIAIYVIYENLFWVKTDDAFVQANTVILTAKAPGLVQEVLVKENDVVKKGQVLVKIDSRDYENAVKQYTGDLQSMDSRLHDAETNYKRLKGLFEKAVISQQSFDQSSANFKDLFGKADSLKAQLAQAELNLANTQIRAPEDGIIAKKSVEVGQLAIAGSGLLGFVSSRERWVTANLKETDIKNIREGEPVAIAIDAYPDRAYEGVIESISPATGASFSLIPPDNATGNYTKVVQRVPVRIKIQNVKPEDVNYLRAGLSALVAIKIR